MKSGRVAAAPRAAIRVAVHAAREHEKSVVCCKLQCVAPRAPPPATQPVVARQARRSVVGGMSKRRRTPSPEAELVTLTGGHAEKPGTVAKFRSSSHCDVQLQPAGGAAPRAAHRLVLMASSAFFEAMWSGAWSSTPGPLLLHEIGAAALDACLEFMYLGECQVERHTLLDVLEAAAYFQSETLIDAATVAVQSGISPQSCLTVLALADRHSLPALASAALSVASTNFELVSCSAAWTGAPNSIVGALLADESISADESAVLRAAVAWLRARDPPPDEETTTRVLQLVRFALLPPQSLRLTVGNEPLLQTAAARHVLAKPGASTRPRLAQPPTLIVVLGGSARSSWGTGADFVNSVTCLDPVTGQWSELPDMPVVRRGASAGVLGGKLYVCGGTGPKDGNDRNDSTDEFLARVDVFDLATQKWQPGPPMIHKRSANGVAAVLGGKIYVVAGSDFYGEAHLHRSVERFDPVSGTWEMLPLMRERRESPCVAVVAGKLYVFGGCGWLAVGEDSDGESDDDDHRPALDTVECYDPDTNTWAYAPSMPAARYNTGVAVVADRVYVVGGSGDGTSDPLDRVDCFDAGRGSWREMSPMPLPRWAPGVVAIDGEIYALGGCRGAGDSDDVQHFDPKTNKWRVLDSIPLPAGRNLHSVAAVNLVDTPGT